MNRNLLPSKTADLCDEILAIPPQARMSCGQGHIANHGNGMVQNNVTYVYGNVLEDADPEPYIPPPAPAPRFVPVADFTYPYAPCSYPQPPAWETALRFGCTIAIWLGIITVGLGLTGFIALIIAASSTM